jgi:hypothetical protein
MWNRASTREIYRTAVSPFQYAAHTYVFRQLVYIKCGMQMMVGQAWADLSYVGMTEVYRL